jgi:hypothetical protein
MRQLIGKMPTKECNVTQEVYLSELIRCRECQKTTPIGIEVIMIKRDGVCKTVLNHEYYCRAHGHDYEMKVQSLPIRPHAQQLRSGRAVVGHQDVYWERVRPAPYRSSLNKYFFDVVSPNGEACEYDYTGRMLDRPEKAHDVAELLALDLEMNSDRQWAGWTVHVRDAQGRQFFSIPILASDSSTNGTTAQVCEMIGRMSASVSDCSDRATK